jgi:hypothetical protein
MTPLLLSLLLAADPQPPAPARWEFHDSATFAGRSLVTYRPLELVAEPVRPLAPGDRPPGKARYGVLPVGNRPDDQPAVVWVPDAPGGPEVWIDADGDGRFQPAERHRFDRPTLEVPIRVSYGKGDKPRRLTRTVLLRRRASDGGLSYAVRGYVAGRLDLGGQVYDALLTDHNADGCFDTPGEDRVWIDLDRDGAFDPLTEQFPLGTPVTVGSRAFLLQPLPDGSAMRVRERPAERGTLRLAVAVRPGVQAGPFAAQLVSDWGELVTVGRADEPVSLPVGHYTVESLTWQLTDGEGRAWSYHFAGERRFAIDVKAGRETTYHPLSGLALHTRHSAPTAGVAPGQEVQVTPSLRTPDGLELVNAEYLEAASPNPVPGSADIQLVAPDGSLADRTSSGFQ